MGWDEYRRDGEHVCIDKTHPPLIDGDKVLDAELLEQDRKLFFTRPEYPNDNKLIVRINTRSIFRSSHPGTWEKPTLRPRLIANGTRTDVGVGKTFVSSWKDGLFIFAPGDHVLVRPEGWRDPVLVAYPHGQEIVVVSPEQGKHLVRQNLIKPIPTQGRKLLPTMEIRAS